jgi:hypothetical protein
MMRKGNSLIMSTLKNTGTYYESTFINFITRPTIKSVPLIGCHDSQKDLKIVANGVKIFTQRTSLEGLVNAYSICIDAILVYGEIYRYNFRF